MLHMQSQKHKLMCVCFSSSFCLKVLILKHTHKKFYTGKSYKALFIFSHFKVKYTKYLLTTNYFGYFKSKKFFPLNFLHHHQAGLFLSVLQCFFCHASTQANSVQHSRTAFPHKQVCLLTAVFINRRVSFTHRQVRLQIHSKTAKNRQRDRCPKT